MYGFMAPTYKTEYYIISENQRAFRGSYENSIQTKINTRQKITMVKMLP